MQGTRTPPPRTPEPTRLPEVRATVGHLLVVAASLLTLLATAGGVAAFATSGTEADLYWFFTGLLSCIAAAFFLGAIILLRASGWVLPPAAALLAVLIAAGIYGGVRDGEQGIPLVIASVVVLFGSVVTLLRGRAAAHRN